MSEAVDAAFALVTTEQVADVGGMSRRSVQRARARGSMPRGKAGESMARAIEKITDGALTVAELLAKEPRTAPQSKGNAPKRKPKAAPKPVSTRPKPPQDRVLGEVAGLLHQTKQEEMLLKRARRVKIERENAVSEGELVPREQVMGRVQAAANVFRMGEDLLRREIEDVSCPVCQGEVERVVSRAWEETRRKMVGALGGDG